MPSNHNFTPKQIYPKKKRLKKAIISGIATIALGTAAMQAINDQNIPLTTFQANIANIELSAPFDGTSLPIDKIPNWAILTEEERKYNFEQLNQEKLIPLPKYNAFQLAKSIESFIYGSNEYNDLVNLKTTYSVPYLGDYSLSGVEGAGSHPAVDLKIPTNTPIKSIANGIVMNAKISDGGFGNYITIAHRDAPLSDIDQTKGILYSTYAHLSKISVSMGDIIEKGQLIGYSGNSGLATTPHLHLQIDKSTAPFTPYWPFTSTEAKNAGYTFFDAINNGLGKENAIAYTINPMTYVQSYIFALQKPIEPDSEVKTSTGSTTSADKIIIPSPPKPEPEIPDEQQPAEEQKSNFTGFRIIHDEFYIIDNPVLISVKTVSETSEIVTTPKLDEDVKVSFGSSDNKPSKDYLAPADFINGEAIISFTPEKAGELIITLTYKNQTYKSEKIILLSTIKTTEKFILESDGDFVIGEPEKLIITLRDRDGKITTSLIGINDIRLESIVGSAVFNPEKVSPVDFTDGSAIIEFTGTALENIIVRADSGQINSISDEIKAKVFEDVTLENKYANTLNYLKKNKIVGGYPDKTYRGDRNISRVESLKLVLEGANKNLVEGAKLTFSDIIPDSWYYPYIATAQNLEIVEGYPDNTFKPANSVTRAEFFKILIEAFAVEIDLVVPEKPYDDVGILEWYAPYAQLVRKLNLLETSNNQFEADRIMTRYEIAEAIYRILTAN